MDREQPAPDPQVGNLVLGGVLVLLGGVWLLGVMDLVDVSLQVILSLALFAVGAGLIWGSRTARHAGLIAAGIVLTAGLVFSTVIETIADGIGGGVGERVVGADDVDGRRLGIGSLTLDLRGGDLSGDVEASVGIGELVVLVDDASVVSVEARAGIGEVRVFGRSSGGLGPRLRADADDQAYRLVLSVGIGKVEVTE